MEFTLPIGYKVLVVSS